MGAGSVQKRRPTSGFTLLELVVVVGIAATLVGLAVYQFNASRERVTIERALADFQGRVMRAQALAGVAGSRLGPVAASAGASRFVYGPTCTDRPAEQQLWIRFNGATVELPSQLIYDEVADQLRVECETFDLNQITRGLGVFALPAPGFVFGFSPNGRTLTPAGPAAPIFVQVSNPADYKTYAFRVLPSGVMCPATTPGGPLCDQAAGP